MLKQLVAENLTAFSRLDMAFSPGLNVVVGENGSGKSHLLKALYSLISCSAELGRKTPDATPTKAALERAYADKLVGVFRPEQLGRLASRRQGRSTARLQLTFDDAALNTSIEFSTASKTDVRVTQLPQRWHQQSPLFFPTRELLTLYPGFVSLYEGRYIEFEESWRDTCLLLGAPALRGPRGSHAAGMLAPIETAMGGNVVLDNNGRFYLEIPGAGRMEMPLVAEGLRKLAMLARLIATGVVLDRGFLFWDEPEATLNPRLVKLVAAAIHALASHGVQVFVATHSFFLMKEIELLAASHPVPCRYFSLLRNAAGSNQVTVEQSDTLEGLQHVVALEEELAQYDRELHGAQTEFPASTPAPEGPARD